MRINHSTGCKQVDVVQIAGQSRERFVWSFHIF
jgi:hypothetical protein